MTGLAEVRRQLVRPRWLTVAGCLLGCWLALGEARAAVQLDPAGRECGADTGAGPRFVVLSGAEVGLDVRHRAGAAGAAKRFRCERLGAGLGLVDLDADGDLDVYLVQSGDLDAAGRPLGAADALRVNDGGGHFLPAALGDVGRGFGFGVVAGDLDADGDEDLLVTNLGPNELLRNDGAGGLTSVPGAAGLAGLADEWSLGAALGDPDGDGDLDVYVANYLRHVADPARAPGAPCATAGCPRPCGPLGALAQPDRFFINDGRGLFRERSVETGLADGDPAYAVQPVFGDLDGDGDLDLFVTHDRQPNRCFVNLGRDPGSGLPRFAERGARSGLALSATGLTQAGLGVTLADLDGDLAPDLFVSGAQRDPHALFLNATPAASSASRAGPAAQFFDEAGRAGLGHAALDDRGWGACALDADHDGDLDLFVANGLDGAGPSDAQPDRCFVRHAPGRFVTLTAPPGASDAHSRGAAVGDLDGDGDLDVLVAVLDDLPLVWRNEHTPGDDWLQLDLRPLHAAVGAQVVLELGELRALASVRSGGSFLSCEDRRLHFGLPLPAAAALSARVRWPDGHEERFDGLRRGRVQVLTRGDGD